MFFQNVRDLSVELSAANKAQQTAKRAETARTGRIEVANTAGLVAHIRYMAETFPFDTLPTSTLVWAAFVLVLIATGMRINEILRSRSRGYVPIRSDIQVNADGTLCIFSGSRAQKGAVKRDMYIKVPIIDALALFKLVRYVFANIGCLNAKPLYLNIVNSRDGTTNFKSILVFLGIMPFIRELDGHAFTPRTLRCLNASLFYRVHRCGSDADEMTSVKNCVGKHMGHDAESTDTTLGYLSNIMHNTEIPDRKRVIIHEDGMLIFCETCTDRCTHPR